MEIVVGLTERPESRAALDWAADEAHAHNARLHIVWTLTDRPSESPSQVRSWSGNIEAVREFGERRVQQLAERGVSASFLLEPIGTDAAGTLLKVARKVEADLIVIGIRRRSPVGKLVLGSVSQDVLLGADCPVLVVKSHDEPGH